MAGISAADGQRPGQLPRVGVWSLLAPPGWRPAPLGLANVAVGGNRADPQWSGTLAADDLALRSVVTVSSCRTGACGRGWKAGAS